MRNWTESNKQTGVGNALKRHYQNYLWEYEVAHPEDVTLDRCVLCNARDREGGAADWLCCDCCENWVHHSCDKRPGLGQYKDYTQVGGRLGAGLAQHPYWRRISWRAYRHSLFLDGHGMHVRSMAVTSSGMRAPVQRPAAHLWRWLPVAAVHLRSPCGGQPSLFCDLTLMRATCWLPRCLAGQRACVRLPLLQPGAGGGRGAEAATHGVRHVRDSRWPWSWSWRGHAGWRGR